MLDNVSYIQGPAQALVTIHCPHVSAVSQSKGCIGLPALQPVPCLSGSCMSREGHGHLVYKYTRSIGNCATWCNIPVPLSCRSLMALNLSSFIVCPAS